MRNTCKLGHSGSHLIEVLQVRKIVNLLSKRHLGSFGVERSAILGFQDHTWAMGYRFDLH
jgi:hypothetical protein